MLLKLIVVVAVGGSGCVPWNQIHGPTAGVGLVYRDKLSPQFTAGYGGERFRSWLGYGGDVQVGVEPWRKTVRATALARGSLVFWQLGIGPTMEWSPDGMVWGLTISTGAHVALGRGSNCRNNNDPDFNCLDEDATVFPNYLPRVYYAASFLRGAPTPMIFGADLIVSSYWLRHQQTRAADNP